MSKLRLYGATSGYEDIKTADAGDNSQYQIGSTVTDSNGNVRQASVTAVASTPYTIPSGSSGQLFRLAGTAGTINVNVANFNEGDVVTLVNISSGTITLSFDAWGNGVRIAGGDGTNLASSTATLAGWGVVTLIAIAGTRLSVNGNVS